MTTPGKSNLKKKVQLMLDSGAFSSWNRGEPLKLADYIAWVKERTDYFFSVVSLDEIAGKFGVRSSPEEFSRAASVTYANHQKMKEAGIKAFPVFHQGESFKWLDRYLEENEPYIGLATFKDIRAHQQRQWLDEVFTALTDRKGRPLVKTHGFGITSYPLLIRYPWYTVDSTTWALAAGYGKIFVPKYNGDRPDYSAPPYHVIMSGFMQGSKSAQAHQFELLSEQEQAAVRHFIEDEVGQTVQRVRYDDSARRAALLTYYQRFAETRKLFIFDHRLRSMREGVMDRELAGSSKVWQMSIMFVATVTSRKFSELLTEAGIWTRLLNYFDLRTVPDSFLDSFVSTGLHPPAKRAVPMKEDWASGKYVKYRRMMLIDRLERLQNEDENLS